MNRHTQQDLVQPQLADSLSKFEYIDLLRGLAILGVIAVHSQQQIPTLFQLTSSIFNYGQLGVQLFFVASALTLCLSMTERKEATPANFYIRRFFRIAPLYYFGIILYFLWRISKEYYKTNEINIPSEYSVIGVIENLLFLHGFHPKNFNFVVPGGWSIATEMAFYAIFPILFTIQSKLRFNGFLKFTLLIIFISFISQFVAIEIIQPALVDKGIIKNIQVNDEFGFMNSSIVNQINVFLIGMLTFKKLKETIISNSILLFAALLCCVSCFLLNTATFKTGYNGFIYPILSAVAFGIFAIKLSNIKSFTNIFSKYLIKIGKVSFSMYLLHFLFLEIVNYAYKKTLFKELLNSELQLMMLFLTLTAITYIAAELSYKKLEKPAINFGKRFIQSN